jgi:hypothetical protein
MGARGLRRAAEGAGGSVPVYAPAAVLLRAYHGRTRCGARGAGRGARRRAAQSCAPRTANSGFLSRSRLCACCPQPRATGVFGTSARRPTGTQCCTWRRCARRTPEGAVCTHVARGSALSVVALCCAVLRSPAAARRCCACPDRVARNNPCIRTAVGGDVRGRDGVPNERQEARADAGGQGDMRS